MSFSPNGSLDVLSSPTAKDAIQFAAMDFAESNQSGLPVDGYFKKWCTDRKRKFSDKSIANAEKELSRWVEFYRSTSFRDKSEQLSKPSQPKETLNQQRLILFDCPSCGRRLSRMSSNTKKTCNFCRAKLEFNS
jgi:hypothetical protein